MRKLYGFALCAGLASVLAVVYTLLHLPWEPPPDPPPPAAAVPTGAAGAVDRADPSLKTPGGASDSAVPERALPEPAGPEPAPRDAAPSGNSGQR